MDMGVRECLPVYACVIGCVLTCGRGLDGRSPVFVQDLAAVRLTLCVPVPPVLRSLHQLHTQFFTPQRLQWEETWQRGHLTRKVDGSPTRSRREGRRKSGTAEADRAHWPAPQLDVTAARRDGSSTWRQLDVTAARRDGSRWTKLGERPWKDEIRWRFHRSLLRTFRLRFGQFNRGRFTIR